MEQDRRQHGYAYHGSGGNINGDTISGASGYGLNVVMDSSTGGAAGQIYYLDANITTYGGNIYMGGGSLNGSGLPTSYALGGSTGGGPQIGLIWLAQQHLTQAAGTLS